MTVTEPRHFYLNEAHAIAPGEPSRGGGRANFEPVDWSVRAVALAHSFRTASARPVDPGTHAHRFIVAVPAALTKLSESKDPKVQKAGGKIPFRPDFGGTEAVPLKRIGFDLIAVDSEGRAIVHVAEGRVPQLEATMSTLDRSPRRDQDRWIHVGEFAPVAWTSRVDVQWLDALDPVRPVDAHLRLHPMLSRAEANGVLEAIGADVGVGGALIRAGRDFSGRYWCIARLDKAHIVAIAQAYPSLQSIHPRMSTQLAGSSSRGARVATAAPLVDVTSLPTIGMLDAGVPDHHPSLRPYIRNTYVDPALRNELQVQGDHGSQVASVLIFGRVPVGDRPSPADLPGPTCRIIDMLGSWTQRRAEVPDEMWTRVIDGVVGNAPDTRVFNFSLGGRPPDAMTPVERREKLNYLQDLDNKAFELDVLFVISAGNSPPGFRPSKPYPDHIDDDAWRLGVLAQTYNGLVVGAHVDRTVPTGIATTLGAPSPFTLIGPGQLRAPVPGFSAPGGDSTGDYARAPGSGVLALNATGMVEDCAGTSFAAPLVAREAAFAFRDLAPYCLDGKPFASTVRAWLTLEARRPPLFGRSLERLAKRTIGKGFPDAAGLRRPASNRAVFVWQTVLDAAGAESRVMFPVPRSWREQANSPALRVVVAWLTPVNAALTSTWACRSISAKIYPSTDPAATSLFPPRGSVGAYPVIDRVYDLADLDPAPTGDLWSLALTYTNVGDPPPMMAFSAQQRVSAVLELVDRDPAGASPQAAVQAVPIAPMVRLTAVLTPILTPVVVR